jgi:hypothetical protein
MKVDLDRTDNKGKKRMGRNITNINSILWTMKLKHK